MLDMHPSSLQPGSRIDRYLVEGLLGRGGMAKVYLVRHVHVGSLHALKVLSGTGPAVERRLLLEGRIQGQLRDSRIVHVTDIVDVNGSPGLVMEYIDGPSLAVLIAQLPPSLAEADGIARSLLGAMALAHDQGLVHRDLKPANILMHAEAGRLLPKVADFGLAKVIGAGLGPLEATKTGVMMGTPRYMAPDQIRDAAHVDARADVFALGAILWELLVHEPVFRGQNLPALITSIDGCDTLDLAARVPHLPQRMIAAIEGALRFSTADRWADASALLEAWCEGSPTPNVVWSSQSLDSVRSLAPQYASPTLALGSEDSSWTESTKPPPPGSFDVTAASPIDVVQDPITGIPDPSRSAAPSAPSTPSYAESLPRPAHRRALWAGITAAAVAGALVASGGMWWAASHADSVLIVAAPTASKVSDNPLLQARSERVWQLLHRGETRKAHSLALQVAEAEPTSAWAWFAASMTAPSREVASYLETAAQQATGATPEERLVRLCSRSLMGQSLALDWDELEQSSNLPIFLIARARFGSGEGMTDVDAQRASWQAAQAARPDSVVPLVELIHLESIFGDEDLSNVLMDEAQLRYPASPEVLRLQIMRALLNGNYAEAHKAATAAVSLDTADALSRRGLASALLHLGEFEAAEAQVDILTHDGSAAMRGGAATAQARVAFGLGRLHDTERLLEICRRIATEDNDVAVRLSCELEAFGFAFLLGDAQRIDRVADALEALDGDSGIPTLQQPELRFRNLVSRAIAAATAGDLEGAEVARERLNTVGRTSPNVGVEGGLSFVDRAIQEAKGERNQAFVDRLVSDGNSGSVCLAARHLDQVGATEEAQALYRQVLLDDGHQRKSGLGQFAKAFAATRLAELTIEGDASAARQALAALDANWTLADPDHPLVIRAEAVRARIGTAR
ncbi:MAG: serine/threonine protein kinase [Kiritimatiellia bacterium]|jgi:serine/threonine protein kinase